MKPVAICLLWICASGAAYGQSPLRSLLKTASEDPEVKSVRDQITYLEARPYRLSPIQKVEFRTKNNQLDPGRQDYALRFNPANPWEIKGNNRYYEQFEKSLRAEYELKLKEALRERYLVAIEYYASLELLGLADRVIALQEKSLSTTERQLGTSGFDADKLIEARLDLMEELATRDELRLELIEMEGEIAALSGWASGMLDTSDVLVDIESVRLLIDSVSESGATHAGNVLREAELELANREYALEKSNVNVGFLQTEYESYRTEQGREPWSISMGITVPIANPNKGDMTRRRLQAIDAMHDLELERKVNQTAAVESRRKLELLISYHQEMEERLKALNVGSIESLLLASRNQDPKVGLKFQLNLLKLETIRSKTRYRLYEAYVDFLDAHGLLQRSPLVNYLSNKLEPIDD